MEIKNSNTVKNKQYFLRMAIIKTMVTGCFYLLVPIGAKVYHEYVGSEYIGYTIFGSGVMIVGNFILLVRAWFFAFDKDTRKSYYSED